ncbi:MAG: MATE family efflux transporter, partial [Bacteroides sp.]
GASHLYLNIYTLGLIFLFFYNIATGIFSAMGDTKTPFILLALSSTANILVDILFVKEFNMGVAGVGWATFCCQGTSCVLAVMLVFRRLAKIEAGVKAPVFSWNLLGKITNIAVPSILQQSFVSVGNIIIQSVINGYGPGVIAGYSAAIKLNNMVITSFTTLGNGMSNFTAQNIGAGKTERVKKGLRAGIVMVFAICIPVVLLYIFGGNKILLLFINDRTGEAMSTGMDILRILSPFYCVVGTKLMCDGVLRGAGAMKMFMSATFTDLVLRVVLAVILSARMGTLGIWSAWPVGWGIATAMSVYFYAHGKWKSYSIT